MLWESGYAELEVSSGSSVTIGRGPDCTLRVDHVSVSRRHARLVIGDAVTIEDLGSANGTRVGGEPIAAGVLVPCAVGTVMEIGDAVVVLHDLSAASRGDATLAGGAMADVRRLIDRVARGSVPVTLVGETGVGKELLAERLHEKSPRAPRRFVRINCAALPENLLESELFGYERGAFTGAVKAKEGLLEAADGGTVFLDEIAELPLAMQAKLLRALECKEVFRIGGLRPKSFDVRFVAATNRELESMVMGGAFRADLFHRLCGVTIRVPPLRERRSEIQPLAQEFVVNAAAQIERTAPELGDDLLAAIRRYPWPGNVRELRHVIDCALLVCDGRVLRARHLPERVREGAGERPEQDLRGELDRVERARIIEALERCAGNQTRAAKVLGIPRRVLISRMEKHGLPRPRKGMPS